MNFNLAQSPLIISVSQGSGAATSLFGITAGSPPVFVAPNTLIGSMVEGNNAPSSLQISVTDFYHLALNFTATGFPMGLTFNTTGNIIGIAPTVPVDTLFTLNVTVVNTAGNFAMGLYTMIVKASYINVLSSGTLATCYEGALCPSTVTAVSVLTGTITLYTILTGSLPTGLVLNSVTGAITGTAGQVSTETTFTFTVQVKNSFNKVNTSVPLSIVIAVTRVTIGCFPRVTSFYTQQTIPTITCTAISSPVASAMTYAVLNGSFPAGLNLDPTTGLIIGTINSGIVPVPLFFFIFFFFFFLKKNLKLFIFLFLFLFFFKPESYLFFYFYFYFF